MAPNQGEMFPNETLGATARATRGYRVPRRPLFDGPTYEATRDLSRLSNQFTKVFALMRDGAWRSLEQIVGQVGGTPQAISARLRDCRKLERGSHKVDRRHVHEGLHEYRLTVNPSGLDLALQRPNNDG